MNLTCPSCGQEHVAVDLASGERAHCVRCDAVIARRSRLGPDAAAAFAVTGLALSVPAATLPFVSAGALGEERVSLLFTGVGFLWDDGMRALGVLVMLCGWVVPFAFLGILAVLDASDRRGWKSERLAVLNRLFRAMEHWAIPEVQVLAVLVALTKLGGLIRVTVGPGFWCYCAMTLSLLLAQRSFLLKAAHVEPAGAPALQP